MSIQDRPTLTLRTGEGRGLDRFGELEPLLQRAHDRSTTGGLGGVDSRELAGHEADFPQLPEAAVDSRQQRATGNRRHEVTRKPPAKLLGNFEADRFCSSA